MFGLVQEEVFQKLGGVSVTARQAVESVLTGHHKSVRRGLSVEFASHRPYLPGDDLRHLDWFVYARTERFDVRVYEEETRLRATLLLDSSGSMNYGAGEQNKFSFAKGFCAALAYLMVRQSDSIGLALGNSQLKELIEPGSTMPHLMTLLSRLEEVVSTGATALAPFIRDVAEKLNRRGLVILFTDGFDEPSSLADAINFLRYRKQEVRVFQVLHRDEETFGFRGAVEFQSLENEPKVYLDAGRGAEFYREAFLLHQQQLAENCHRAGAQLQTCFTDQDLGLTILHALNAGPAARV